jgi:hypothetical protein
MKTRILLSFAIVALLSSCATETKTEDSSIENVQEETTTTPEVLENYETTQGSAEIKFATEKHDFGEVKKGEKVPYSFAFVNSGDQPLLITDARGSCGCTIPFFPKDPIKPGEQGKIDVTVDTERKTAGKTFTVFVTVESNAVNKSVRLELTGVPVE